MTVSFIGGNSSTGSAVTIPTHQAGDLLVIWLYNGDGSEIIPPSGGGWSLIDQQITQSPEGSFLISSWYKIASSGSETSGTWIAPFLMVSAVFRSTEGAAMSIVAADSGGALNSSTISYFSGGTIPSSTYTVYFGATPFNQTTSIETPPPGSTRRMNGFDSFSEVVIFDEVTSGEIFEQVSLGTPTDWVSQVFAIVELGPISGSTQGLSFSALVDNAYPGIGFIGAYTSTDVTSNSLTVPHQEGDLLVGFAFRDGSATNPSVPGGWTTITNTLDGTGCSATVAYKFATGSSETTGAWTNATEIIIHVYRRAKFNGTPNFNTNAASSTTVNYPALTLRDSSRSWVAGFSGHRSTNTSLETAPTNMFNRSTFVDSAELSGHDTNVAPGGNWPSTDVSVGGTSSGWTSIVIELEHQESIAGSSSLILDLPNTLLSRDGLYRVSATVITASSGTMPAHSVGDLIIGFAFRDGSTNNPSVPGGWTTITNTLDGTTCSAAFAYKVAQSDAETTGTWTNATALIIQVFRNGYLPASINYANSAAASTTVTYPALAALNAAGTSWVAGFAGHRSTNTSLETAPSGMINEATGVNSTNEGAAHSSGGPLAAWAGNNVSVSGTSSGWISTTIEIQQLDRMKISPTYLLFNAIIDGGGGGANIGPIINTYYRRLRE